jgi:hypothetical protein
MGFFFVIFYISHVKNVLFSNFSVNQSEASFKKKWTFYQTPCKSLNSLTLRLECILDNFWNYSFASVDHPLNFKIFQISHENYT